MAAPCDIILTSSNYFSWKSCMEDVLQRRGLFTITLGKETEPTDDDKKTKWQNRCDEDRGLIGMSISTNLRFHISGIDEPDKACESWNLCLVNTMKSGVIKLRMSWFPWIQMIFHGFKNIYLS